MKFASLTVGQLRRVIADLADDVEVVIDLTNLVETGFYTRVRTLALPCESGDDEGADTLTLAIGESYDTRFVGDPAEVVSHRAYFFGE